jgi:hypothetical protein
MTGGELVDPEEKERNGRFHRTIVDSVASALRRLVRWSIVDNTEPSRREDFGSNALSPSHTVVAGSRIPRQETQMTGSDSDEDRRLRLDWIRIGVGAGFVAVASYTFLLLASGDLRIAYVAASAFSVALGLASYGLYQFITIEHRSAIAQIATVATILGAVVFLAMASVQLSIRSDLDGVDPTTLGASYELVNRVQLGLDVAWDVHFAVGMAMFGIAAYTHPRLGRVLGVAGVLLASALLVLNIVTFPIPPSTGGTFDLGPFAGLWYFVVTIQITRSLSWARDMAKPGISTNRSPR